mmetsp:Transcript_25352/g.100096  ORF Transcript_25352/g.100096 Transcript_25352/m.100096 type:complete len:92 (-) Transcript_25352:470-745(-)
MPLKTRIFHYTTQRHPKFQPKAPLTGLVEYTWSPYELKLFGDWRDWSVIKYRLRYNLYGPIRFMLPSALFIYAVFKWADGKHDRLAKEHRY